MCPFTKQMLTAALSAFCEGLSREWGKGAGPDQRGARFSVMCVLCVQQVKHTESETVATSQTEERLLSEWTGRRCHNQTSQFCLNCQIYINCPLHTVFSCGVIFGVCINKCRRTYCRYYIPGSVHHHQCMILICIF